MRSAQQEFGRREHCIASWLGNRLHEHRNANARGKEQEGQANKNQSLSQPSLDLQDAAVTQAAKRGRHNCGDVKPKINPPASSSMFRSRGVELALNLGTLIRVRTSVRRRLH